MRIDLLATLITGAARLVLALAEFQVGKAKLKSGFCDTDGSAIANTAGDAASDFKAKVLAVVGSFTELNPYGESRSTHQLRRRKFPACKAGQLENAESFHVDEPGLIGCIGVGRAKTSSP
ncbi:MAG: hypothetical protein JO105_14690 [Hyphomicrobiales bacterium]|nr:hypothetical protein [Hyphomicrobiales bacterium]